MKFDVLDKKMRIFETAHDYRIIPGIYVVARIDGRSFTKLPNWQKRGIGIYWEEFAKDAVNPKTGKSVKAIRKKLK